MPSSDIIKLVYALLPGFLTAWIFYGLTPHPRRDAFERVAQALVFTAIVQGFNFLWREFLFKLNARYEWNWGRWDEDTSLFWSLVIAALLGFVFAGAANNSIIHGWLGKRKWYLLGKHPDVLPAKCWTWTKRTAYPSEWFSAFNADRRYVILHLEGGRRLHGWPYEWPDQPDSGHFVLLEPTWLTDTNERARLHHVKRMLVPAKIVEMVEIMLEPHEITASEDDLKFSESLLLKGEEDGKQGTATIAGPAEESTGGTQRSERDNLRKEAGSTPDFSTAPTKEEVDGKEIK